MSNFEENKKSIVEIDSSIYAKNDSGVAKKLKYLGFPSTEHLHRINFYLRSNGYLRFFLSGNFNDLAKFEKVFKEIAPYLCDHELFHAYVKDSPEGSYEFLYYIRNGELKKYKEVKE